MSVGASGQGIGPDSATVEAVEAVAETLGSGTGTTILRVVLLLALGLPLAYSLGKWVRGWLTRRHTAQSGLVAGKLVFYSGLALVVVSVMTELGFSLAPLLGAAGIVGIALGFASQTSVSNVISGIFLMTEQPFVVGDLITVGGTTGFVLSVDTLSVKLRTFDNKFVRIPNETIIKSEVQNITRFPIRRLDLNIGVAYKEDIGRVREALLEVAEANPLALQEPEPLVIFTGFGNSAVEFLFAVWCVRTDFLALRTTLTQEIHDRFRAEGIEIPFPHVSLYAGSATEPLPVRIEEGPPEPESPGDAGDGPGPLDGTL